MYYTGYCGLVGAYVGDRCDDCPHWESVGAPRNGRCQRPWRFCPECVHAIYTADQSGNPCVGCGWFVLEDHGVSPNRQRLMDNPPVCPLAPCESCHYMVNRRCTIYDSCVPCVCTRPHSEPCPGAERQVIVAPALDTCSGCSWFVPPGAPLTPKSALSYLGTDHPCTAYPKGCSKCFYSMICVHLTNGDAHE